MPDPAGEQRPRRYAPGLKAKLYRPGPVDGDAPGHRRLSRGRRLWYRLMTPLVGVLIRAWWASCRIEAVVGGDNVDAIVERGQPVIPVYWHQHMVFCAHYLLGLRRRGLRIGFLITPSVDGEVPSRIMRSWGAEVFRGSTTRTGAQAMRELYQAIVRDRISPVTTSDGPTGPARKFKRGAVMLAQLSGAPIVPVAYAARGYWELRRWDRFIIPYPFTRIVIGVGEPVYVPRGVGMDDLQPYQDAMEAALNDLDRRVAERAAARGSKPHGE